MHVCVHAFIRLFVRLFVRLLSIIYWSLWLHGTLVLCVRVNQKQMVKEGKIERDDWPIHWCLVIDSFFVILRMIPSIVIVQMIPSNVMVFWYYGSVARGNEANPIKQRIPQLWIQ